MKKNFLLVMMLVAILGTATSQQRIVKTYFEQTQIGAKSGTSIGMLTRYNWEYGAFFQESSLLESLIMSEEQRAQRPRNYERQFYGVYFAAPIFLSEFTSVKFQVRTGISNNQNFVITPSVHMGYEALKNFRFELGVGTRAFRPTLMGGISLAF